MPTLLRFLVLSVLLLSVTPASFGQAEDTTPPQLASFVFAPASIDTTDAAAMVAVRFTAVDDASGVTFFRVFFRSPSGQPSAAGQAMFGAMQVATSTVFIPFPKFIETGTWVVAEVLLQDDAGNQTTLNTEDIDSLGFPTRLQVASFQDRTAPALAAFNFTPKTIDTNAKSGAVQASFTLTDDSSGAQAFDVVFQAPSGKPTRSGHVQLSPGGNVKGSIAVTFPEFSPPGVWNVSEVRISDASGNAQILGTADLAAKGFPTSLTVLSVEDATPPTLAAFNFTPNAIETRFAPATILMDFNVTDDLSGVTSIAVTFLAPGGKRIHPSGVASFDPTRNASTTIPITFPQFSQPGIWTISEIRMEDFTGNVQVLGAGDIAALGFPTQLSVDVAGNQPPVALAGADQTAECTSSAGAAVTLDGSASFDPDGDPLTYTWTGPFGTVAGAVASVTLPLGSSTVTLTVTDGRGGSSSASVTITVVDTTPPALSLSPAPNMLVPADHSLVEITAFIDVGDACQATSVVLVSITSSEPDQGLSDDDVPGDIQGADFGTDDRSFLLRAERGPGKGRTYTVTYQASDLSGNTSTATAQVTVPASGAGPQP